MFFIWFVMLPTHGTSQQDPASLLAAFAFKEPTHVLLSGQYSGWPTTAGLQVAPIGSWDQFQEIISDSSVIEKPQSVAFDPVEQRVYWGDRDLEAIFRCKLDGSQVERVFDNIQQLRGLAIDPVNRRMVFSANRTTIQSSNLDGTGSEILVNNGTSNWEVAIDTTRSRVYWSDDGGDEHIGRVNIDGSGYVIVVPSTDYYVYAITVDETGERLFWTQSDDDEIFSSDLDGNNITLHIELSSFGDQYGLAFYQNQFIVGDTYADNVVVLNFTSATSTQTREAGEQLPSVFGERVLGVCLFYKYEPPTPIYGIKLIQSVTKRGMIIARVNVPIEVEMAGWTVVINFPRQVFDLKIFGCDVEIQDKYQTKPGGLRLGTKYTLISAPGSDIPSIGSKLRFKIEAKTWQKQRGFPRGILADFYPTPLVE